MSGLDFSKVLPPQIRKLVPEVPDYGVSAYADPTEKAADEVYACVPTASTSQGITNILNDYVFSLNVNPDELNVELKSHRTFLTNIELFCVLADVYGLVAACRKGWDILFIYSSTTRRFVDASYALVNQLLCSVIDMENSYPDISPKQILTEVVEMTNKLVKYRYLLDATDEAVRSGQLPTPHAQFQCVMIDVGRAYVEHYGDWLGYSTATSLIPTKHERLFSGKSFMSICARGYYYWNHLRARCIFGATGDSLSPKGEPFSNIATENPTSNPDCILYQAVVVRMYGRTLMHYLYRHYQQKLSKVNTDENKDKENKENEGIDSKASVEVIAGDLMHPVWSDSRLPDGDLLCLWLGIRLMIFGSLQATELYTIHGTIREAQAYQIELLRISQCFHVLKYTQVAISLMAHVDMFAQRRWAFEVHLRQLHHIATSKMSLEEIYQERMRAKKLEVQRSEDLDEDADGNFLHTLSNSTAPMTNACQNKDDAFGDCFDTNFGGTATHGSTQSAGQNPLLAANSNAFADIFPCSPPQDRRRLRRNTVTDKASKAFPSVLQLTSLITGKVSCPTWPITDRPGNPEELDRALRSAGGLALNTCVQRVLHAIDWPWLTELSNLVREQLLPVAHQLPILLPSQIPGKSPRSTKTTAMNGKVNHATTEDLVTAFTALACSPDRSISDGSSKAVPLSPPPAPRRMADRRNSPISGSQTCRVTRGQAKRMKSAITSVDGDVNQVVPSSGGLHRTQHRRPRNTSTQKADNDINKLSVSTTKPSTCTELRGCPKKLRFYMDDEDKEQNNEFVDPVETCPSLIGVSSRPRNLRLATRWAAQHQRVTRRQPSPCQQIGLPPLDSPKLYLNEELAERLQTAYLRLAAFPVPNLLRPVCHWLGLYWLSRGNQAQAGRFFSQAVGIAATTIYKSILCARFCKSPPGTPPEQRQKLLQCYQRTRSVSAPNHPLTQQEDSEKTPSCRSAPTSCLRILQFCLVDELVATESRQADSDEAARGPSSHSPVAFGVGARTGGYLVVTRFTGVSSGSTDGLRAESRVIHSFTCSGLKMLDTFDELQVESIDSMLITDRVRYWRMRYGLDDRMETLLSEIRTDWFTSDDVNWLFYPTANAVDYSTVLILDRRLAHLPWEWIMWDMHKPFSRTGQMPTFTRNFSVPLVLGQLVGRTVFNSETDLAVTGGVPHTFNPHEMFYVVNPEANLSATQQTFQPLFQDLSSHWHGVLGRIPSIDEVNSGFVDHDLFMYLGHGNGSRFLLHTFNRGLTARAAGLVLGCSSGRPNGEGRHEFYSSLFNHLIAGCPFVAGLLWDVTDRDLDRFTVKLLKKWLFRLKEAKAETLSDEEPSVPSLATCMTQARLACKLKNLVGKSMIIYGLPAEPAANALIPLPTSLLQDLLVDKPRSK